MSGFGTLLRVRVAGGAARADALVNAVQLMTHATSFDAVEWRPCSERLVDRLKTGRGLGAIGFAILRKC